MNCQKRTVLCTLYDSEGRVIAEGRNLCTPPNGKCARVGIVEGETEYTGLGCNSVHAEIVALMKAKDVPLRPLSAKLEGHDFPCPDCRKALRAAGVVTIEVIPMRKIIHAEDGRVLAVHAGPQP